MYGSIHNHFESQYDTANRDFKEMLLSYAALGAKKVVVTDHGVFTAFEDARDMLAHLQKEGECLDLELIPGVEGYFAETKDRTEASHLVLFAKDYEGYQSLCRILTQSGFDYRDGKPVITLKNLEEHVAKGHLFCTTACIAGIFGSRFGLERMNLEEKLAVQVQKILQAENGLTCSSVSLDPENTAVIPAPLDEELLLTGELLEQPAFRQMKALNCAKKGDSPLLVQDLLAVRTEELTEAELLLHRYRLTLANEAILEAFRKEKAPKAGKRHAVNPRAEYMVNPLAFRYYEQRKQFYEENSGHYRLKHPKAALFRTLERQLAEWKALPAEETTHRNCLALYRKFVRIFGKEQFYFELQYHGLEQEAILYPKLVEFAKETGNTDHFIISNDVHIGCCKALYPGSSAEWNAHLSEEVARRDIIRFSRFNRFFEDKDAISPDSYEYYIKDDDELRECVSRIVPDEAVLDNAFANVRKVLESCHVEFPAGETHYPQFCENADSVFEEKLAEGILRVFPNGLPPEPVQGVSYAERLAYESGIIKRMGFSSYLLIVADYLAFGRKLGYLSDAVIHSDQCPMTMEALDAYLAEHQIPINAYSIGPGRGSAVGSLCCYLLGITGIDPLPYGLLFERFLNPDRKSMPDIDSDFSSAVRDASIEYVRRKYGAACICGISTKSYAAVKGAIRLAGRYLGEKHWLHSEACLSMPAATPRADRDKFRDTAMKPFYHLSDTLCRKADGWETKQIKQSFFTCPDLTGDERELLSVARLAVGCFTNYGQHAAGTIISRDVITDSIPLMYSEKKQNMECQCNMEQAETKGFLKMDFLGLNNLDILTACIRATGDTAITDYRQRKRILQNARIYREIYSTGLTQGVFQFESMGMKSVLQRFQPECFEDIVLLNAAYRPGPMQFIDELIAEKWYRKAQADPNHCIQPDGSILWAGGKAEKPVHSITLRHPALQEILAPTYGCIIYQEQIMQICQKLAGFTMGHADDIRRFMSKKKADRLEAERPLFLAGCVESGITEAEAKALFEQMMEFARYAFNKSHACAYSVISVFTAYFKLYHPAVFFAESLNAIHELSELLDFMAELTSFGITLLPPDLLRSEDRFVAGPDSVIFYGLSAIKGITGASYTMAYSFPDFLLANYRTLPLSTMEKLIKCGLFDSMEPSITRMDLVRVLPSLYQACKKQNAAVEKAEGIQSLLAELDSYLKKPRLSLAEKAQIQVRFGYRKTPDRITRKDLLAKQATLTRQLTTKQAEQEEAVNSLFGTAAVTNSADAEDIPNLALLRLTSKHTSESVLYNRRNEQELLGYVFDIGSSLERLESCNTFPAGTVDCRKPVESDIPNLGLVVLNPCIKITPSGWIKVLCCDRNRTTKHLYFRHSFPAGLTEFTLNFKKEELQEMRQRKEGSFNSNNMFIAPYAYEEADIGHTAMQHIFVETAREFITLTGRLAKLQGTRPFLPSACLYCAEWDMFHYACRIELLTPLLAETGIEYVQYEKQ